MSSVNQHLMTKLLNLNILQYVRVHTEGVYCQYYVMLQFAY